MASKQFKQQRIKELEEKGEFNTDLISHSLDNCAVFEQDFEYLPKNLGFKFLSSTTRGLMTIFGPLVNFFGFQLKVKGRENIKGIKKAISVSNHVLNLDCLIVRQGLRRKRVYFTVAPYNCKKNIGGTILKSGGVLPIDYSLSGSKKFKDAVNECLNKNSIVHFWPEQVLWNCYEKPRPLKRGAFLYASEFNVPIIPFFLCFRNPSGVRKVIRSKRKMVTLFIEKPIYPKPELSVRENSIYLMEETQKVWQGVYNKFYGENNNGR